MKIQSLLFLVIFLLIMPFNSHDLLGQVAINEVLYDPDGVDGGSTPGEWIELYAVSDIDLGCFSLTDGDWVITIPAGTQLSAGETYVIGYQGTDPDNGANTGDTLVRSISVDLDISTCNCTAGSGVLNLTNGGEFIALFDDLGTFLEGVIFDGPSAGNSPSDPANNGTSVLVGDCTSENTLDVTANSANFSEVDDAENGFQRIPDGTGSFSIAESKDALTPGALNAPGVEDTCALARDTTNISLTTCDSSEVGTTQEVFSNLAGCDSLVITTTVLAASDTTFLSDTTCNPIEAGVSQVLLTNQLGCDSLVITTISLAPTDTTELNVSTCDSSEVGVSQETFTNQFGCDSLVITTVALAPSDTVEFTAFTCDSSEVGTTQEVFTNQAGCDSLVITTTLFAPSDTTEIQVTTCDSAAAGVSQVIFPNQFGCDSLVITTTILLPSDTTELSAVTCDSAEVGRVEEVLLNQFGCDSLVITTTTLAPIDTTELSLTTCDTAAVGVSEEILTSQFGCDSLVITTTLLVPADTTELSATTCDTAAVGISELLLSNSAGCDSLVITMTSLLPSDTTQLEATTCDSAEVGTSQVVLINEAGCDSVIITQTMLEMDTDSTTSSCDDTVVGIEDEISSGASFVVYPNPFLKGFTLEVDGMQEDWAKVEIYNMLGQVVEQGKVARDASITLGKDLAKGIYFVQLRDGERMQQVKVVKDR